MILRLIAFLLLFPSLAFAQTNGQYISQLPQSVTLTGSELVPLVQSGQTRKVTVSQLNAAFASLAPLAAGGTVLANPTGSAAAPVYEDQPVLGINASDSGTLGLANGGTNGTTITIQNLGNITTGYNFNLPITAGATGALLTSGGGSSTSMVWLADVATGQVLTSGGTSTIPTFSATLPATVQGNITATGALATGSLTTGFTAIGVAQGGTNCSSASITCFNNITGFSAAGTTGTTSTSLVFSTSPTLVTPVLGAATATSITFSPTTGGIVGTTTNDSAGAGKVGEYIASTVGSGAPVSLTSGTGTNITSISLTAGDWDVWGLVGYIPAGSTTCGYVQQSISTTTATIGGDTNTTYNPISSAGGGAVGRWVVGVDRFSLAGTTTIYLVSSPGFGVSTMTGFGTLRARRVR